MTGHDDAGGAQGKASTRDRLIETAVRLFGERGVEATSLRALTEAARTNIAAVNYHFGSKEGLLRAVINQTMELANRERGRRLDELEAGSGTPSVAALVRAFVEPGADLLEGHGPDVARFIGRMVSEPDPLVRQIFADQVNPVEGRYLTALGRALPGVHDDGLRFAYTSMLGLLSLHQSGAFEAVDWPQLSGSGASRSRAGGVADADRDRLVAFITGGILAAALPAG